MIQIKNNSGNKYEYFFVGILIISLVPFLILHYYNQPTPEDFYYSEEANNIGLINSIRVLYKFYGGRYFTYILISLQPMYFHSIAGYKIFGLALMLLFYYVLFLFVSEFTKHALRLSERIVFSLTVFFVYIISMPSSGQGLYWVVSVIHYNIALVLMMLFSIFYFRITDSGSAGKRYLYIFLSCITVIAIPGTIELAAVMMILYVIFLLVKNIAVDRKINWWLLLIAFVTLICVYYVFASPGNNERSARYAVKHQFYNSLYNSFIFLFQSAVSWIFNTPLLIFTILISPLCFKIVNAMSQSIGILSILSMKIRYLVVTFAVFIYADIFVISWSLGIMPYDRILNYIYFIFLIGWFWIAVSFSYYLRNKYKITEIRIPKYIYIVAAVLLAFFLIRENNVKIAYSDLLSGKAAEFDRTLYERYDFLYSSNADSIEVDSVLNVPESFFFQDVTENTNKPFNKGYQSYFKKKYIVRRKYVPNE